LAPPPIPPAPALFSRSQPAHGPRRSGRGFRFLLRPGPTTTPRHTTSEANTVRRRDRLSEVLHAYQQVARCMRHFWHPQGQVLPRRELALAAQLLLSPHTGAGATVEGGFGSRVALTSLPSPPFNARGSIGSASRCVRPTGQSLLSQDQSASELDRFRPLRPLQESSVHGGSDHHRRPSLAAPVSCPACRCRPARTAPSGWRARATPAPPGNSW
jgi:hypothetical protein